MPAASLDVDVLKELREHTLIFLKLDLAYLAAGGAIITALKIGHGELLEFGANLFFVAFAFSILGTFDTIINSLVFNDWLSARIGAGKRHSPKVLRVLLDIQPYLHLFFVIGLLMYAVGFATGFQHVRTRVEGRVLLQEEVESYMQKTGLPPKSLDELKATSHQMKRILAMLDGEGATVEATGPKSYKITFAGWDKTFGTADDEVATQGFLLRKLFERFINDSKTSSTEK